MQFSSVWYDTIGERREREKERKKEEPRYEASSCSLKEQKAKKKAVVKGSLDADRMIWCTYNIIHEPISWCR